MTRKHFYVLVNFTDEVMGIGHNDMLDARDHSLARKRCFSDLGSSLPLECLGIEEVGVKNNVLLYLRFPGGHQPQTPILSKLFLPHQERLRRTFHGGRLLMPLLQFVLQWEQILYSTAN